MEQLNTVALDKGNQALDTSNIERRAPAERQTPS